MVAPPFQEIFIFLALGAIAALLINTAKKAFSWVSFIALALLTVGLIRILGGAPLQFPAAIGNFVSNLLTPVQQTAPVTPGAPASPNALQNLFQPARPAARSGYRVVCPAGKQGLNVRSAPGLSNPIAILPCNASGIQITGSGVTSTGETWVPINYQGLTGWVAQRFLSS